MWSRICEVILKSLYCVHGVISNMPNSFEVFGYDIMLDADAKPWLIEVNSSPSLARENKIDNAVKTQMVADAIDIVDPVAVNRTALVEILRRRLGGKKKKSAASTWQTTKESEARQDLLDVLGSYRQRQVGEMPEKLGNFERIAPSKQLDAIERVHKGSGATATGSSSSTISGGGVEKAVGRTSSGDRSSTLTRSIGGETSSLARASSSSLRR